jgi:hypothetical protein
MRLQDWRPVSGRVNTGRALTLALKGRWPVNVQAQVNCRALTVVRLPGAIRISIPAGRHSLTIGRGC